MKLIRFAAPLLILVFVGCSSPTHNDPRPLARDPVCLYHRDLACVDVRVDQATPKCVHQGETYYFCAEDCRKEFEKDPEKYLAGFEPK